MNSGRCLAFTWEECCFLGDCSLKSGSGGQTTTCINMAVITKSCCYRHTQTHTHKHIHTIDRTICYWFLIINLFYFINLPARHSSCNLRLTNCYIPATPSSNSRAEAGQDVASLHSSSAGCLSWAP